MGILNTKRGIIDVIASDLKLDKDYILQIVLNASYYYKDYSITKRNGGKRLISQPSSDLKILQYWVTRNILNLIPVSNFACAYKKGDSIKKHAKMHAASKFIFHADIEDFFPSIHFDLLEQELKEHIDLFEELNLEVGSSLENIKKICFRNNSLCIGAVSSPAISNIVMIQFDYEMGDFCKKRNLIYSRYADDIYISSDKFIDYTVRNKVVKELRKLGFKLNCKKTHFFSPKCQRKVTGIILPGKSMISIGLKRRKEIKKMLYDKLVKKEGNSSMILGHLSFLKDIEPNTYNKLIEKYSHYCDGDVITTLKRDSEVPSVLQ